MKRLLAILLASVMTLSLCACGLDSPSADSIRGEQIDDGTPEFEAPIDSIEIPEVTDAAEFSLGDTSGITYESKFIGIGFNLPAGWSFYTDEQIKELNNFSIEASGEELQELVENASLIYDMFASDADGVNNINVNLEKVNPLQLIGLDLKQNLENSVPVIRTSYENMGASLRDYKVDTITLDGTDFVCLYSTVDFPHVTIYQCALSIKCNGYMASVTVTAIDEATLSEILNAIYVVE